MFKKLSKFSLFLVLFIALLYGCPNSKYQIKFIKPVLEESSIIQNSSSLNGKGPIPEWVLKIEKEGVIQKSPEDTFFVIGIESNYPEDRVLNPQDYLEAYLYENIPDADLLAKELKLILSGTYWQQLKSGKYQIFFRYTIVRESINECLSTKNKFSQKAIEFLSRL